MAGSSSCFVHLSQADTGEQAVTQAASIFRVVGKPRLLTKPSTGAAGQRWKSRRVPSASGLLKPTLL